MATSRVSIKPICIDSVPTTANDFNIWVGDIDTALKYIHNRGDVVFSQTAGIIGTTRLPLVGFTPSLPTAVTTIFSPGEFPFTWHPQYEYACIVAEVNMASLNRIEFQIQVGAYYRDAGKIMAATWGVLPGHVKVLPNTQTAVMMVFQYSRLVIPEGTVNRANFNVNYMKHISAAVTTDVGLFGLHIGMFKQKDP